MSRVILKATNPRCRMSLASAKLICNAFLSTVQPGIKVEVRDLREFFFQNCLHIFPKLYCVWTSHTSGARFCPYDFLRIAAYCTSTQIGAWRSLVEVTEYSTMLQDSFGQLLICACCYLSACCAEPHLRIQMGLASFSHLWLSTVDHGRNWDRILVCFGFLLCEEIVLWSERQGHTQGVKCLRHSL